MPDAKGARTHIDSAEAALLGAVIAHAVNDCISCAAYVGHGESTNWEDATAFLTEENGGWAQSRRDICDAIGVNDANIRRHVIAILEGRAEPALWAENKPNPIALARSRAKWKERKERQMLALEASKQRQHAAYVKRRDALAEKREDMLAVDRLRAEHALIEIEERNRQARLALREQEQRHKLELIEKARLAAQAKYEAEREALERRKREADAKLQAELAPKPELNPATFEFTSSGYLRLPDLWDDGMTLFGKRLPRFDSNSGAVLTVATNERGNTYEALKRTLNWKTYLDTICRRHDLVVAWMKDGQRIARPVPRALISLRRADG